MSGRATQPSQATGPRTPVILLWGLPEEEPLAAVGQALRARGAQTVMVDQRRALSTHILPRPEAPVLKLPDRDIPLATSPGWNTNCGSGRPPWRRPS